MKTILCISHLRWGFVWQRPQHLLGRFARSIPANFDGQAAAGSEFSAQVAELAASEKALSIDGKPILNEVGGEAYRVVFVEEPVTSTDEKLARLDVSQPDNAPGVTVIKLIYPAHHHFWIGHGDQRTQKLYDRLLVDWLAAEEIEKPILWLYTPMASEFLEVIPRSLFIFDAMDQLSAFAGAPPELIARDQAVLRQADIVFTGGWSLYQAKKPFNPNTHLFPSGVEVEHFAKAADRRTIPRPPELEGLRGPILGYFGVIDERVDLRLIEAIAKAHPEWNIVMIGPVVKINPADLPKAQNVLYPGGRDYSDLPSYLAYFDVALLPFALNEATRYISPTKTLEYMAAHKPMVSTAIRDVIDGYGDVVRVAHDYPEFIRYCEHVLHVPANADQRRREDEYLVQNTWDSIAGRMKALVARQLPGELVNQNSNARAS